MTLKKLVCNLDVSLLAKVDEFAERYHLTRTSAVAYLLSRGLELDNDFLQLLNCDAPLDAAH